MKDMLRPVNVWHWFEIVLSLALLAPALAGCGQRASSTEQSSGSLVMLDGTSVPVEDVETAIAQALDRGAVPGLSCAILNDGQIIYRRSFGYKDVDAGTEVDEPHPNDEETVFAAASFSKTAFAYLVVLLAEEGIIDLDRPLHEYLSKPLPEYPAYADLEGDDRHKQITARIVLSHSTGFPNWRFLTPDGKLSIMFPPGTRHSYSGEGIALLQMVVQEITGEDLEALAQERVFQPLGMGRSSYVWQEAFEDNHARPHDTYGRVRQLQKRFEPDAAGSMMTTAGDYAKLLGAILNAEGKRKASVDEILEPQIEIDSRQMSGPGVLEHTDRDRDIGLSWGLGWGLFDTEHGRAFFHTGHDLGWQNYTVTYADQGIGVVLMSNSDNFEAVAPQLVEAAIGDRHSPFEWLGYPPFDPSIVDRTPPPEPVAVELDATILGNYAGTYEMNSGEQFRVKLEDEQLYIQGPDGEWAPLYAESETHFFIPESEYRFVFVVDDEGQVSGVSIELQGLALPPARKVE
jgi:CubicO group peptidase (beta-lactamase class C family)